MQQRPSHPVLRGSLFALGGLLLCVFVASFFAMVVGFLSVTPHQRASTIAEGRTTGGEMTFETTDQRYTIALGTRTSSTADGLAESFGFGNPAEATFLESDRDKTRCAVEHPDGSTEVVQGNALGTSLADETYADIGAFDGRPGTTRLTCTFDAFLEPIRESEDQPVIVHPAGWPPLVLWLVALTGLSAFLGVGAIVAGMRLSIGSRRREITLPGHPR